LDPFETLLVNSAGDEASARPVVERPALPSPNALRCRC